MNRYSILLGTEIEGTDGTLGYNSRLNKFLQEHNIANPSLAVSKVNRYVRGFTTLSGYEDYSNYEKPVSIRYAPMHLNKLDAFAGATPFCAISVSGSENRIGSRNSEYAMTTFFSRELMAHAQDGYNYFDHLFGTRLVQWWDASRFAAEKQAAKDNLGRKPAFEEHFPETPQKKTPVCDDADKNLVALAVGLAVQAEGKNLIIVPEKDRNFVSRSMELLGEIYSVLPPKVACETGFAVYQDPVDIRFLSKETSIRFFLVPDGEKITDTDCVLINLNVSPVPQQNGDVAKAVERWWSMDWAKRQPAMEACFDRFAVNELLKPETYIQQTEYFFSTALADLVQWGKDTSKEGTLTDLKSLKAEYDKHPAWAVIPWADDAFKSRILPLMGLKKMSEFSALAVQELYEVGASNDETAAELYFFATKFTTLSDKIVCKNTAKLHGAAVTDKLNKKHDAEKNALIKAHEEESAAAALELQTTKEKAIQERESLEKAHAKAIEERDTAFASMVAEKDAAYASMVADKDTAYASMVAEKDNAFAAMRAQAQEKLANAKNMLETEQAQHKADVEAEQKRSAEEKQTLTEKFTAEKQSLSAKLESTAVSLAAATNAKETAENALEQTKSDLETAQGRLTRAEEEFKKIRERLQKTTADRDNALRERDSANEERDNVKAELDAIPQDLRSARKRMDELQDEIDKTPALVRKAWWLPPVLTLLVGALIVGVLWIILGGAASKKAAAALENEGARADKAETVAGKLEEENENLQAEIEALQAEIAELTAPPAESEDVIEENVDEPVDEPEEPTVDYEGWDDEEKTSAFVEAHTDLLGFAFAEDAQGYVPEALTGEWYALAAFSVEENLSNESGSIAILLKAAPAVDPSAEGGLNAALHNVNSVSITASGEDGTTADDSVTAGEPAEAEEPAAETAETGTTETREENQDTPVVKFYGAVLKITCGDEMLLVYGDDDMVTAAMEAVPALFENADEVMKVLLNAARSDEEPDLAVDPEMILTKEVLWGESVRWIVDPSHLNAAAENLNTARMPIFGITNGEAASWIYDYRDAPEKITVFMEAYASIGQVTVQNEFVILTVANVPAEPEATAEAEVPAEPAE